MADLPSLKRLLRNQLAAQVQLAFDLDPGRFERLRADFGDDELLVKFLESTRTWAPAGAAASGKATMLPTKNSRVVLMGHEGLR